MSFSGGRSGCLICRALSDIISSLRAFESPSDPQLHHGCLMTLIRPLQLPFDFPVFSEGAGNSLRDRAEVTGDSQVDVDEAEAEDSISSRFMQSVNHSSSSLSQEDSRILLQPFSKVAEAEEEAEAVAKMEVTEAVVVVAEVVEHACCVMTQVTGSVLVPS